MPNKFLDLKLGQISSVMKTAIDLNPISVRDFLNQVQIGSGGIKEKIQEIRGLVAAGADKTLVSAKKLQLPAVYPHSVASKGTVKAGISKFDLSGFVHFDLDGQSSSDALVMLEAIDTLELQPQIVFLSPSGNGIKIVYFVNGLVEAANSLDASGKKELFNRAWYFLSEKVNSIYGPLGWEVDRAPKNPMSTFFVSYDPKLRVDLISDPIELSAIPELKKKKSQILGLLGASSSSTSHQTSMTSTCLTTAKSKPASQPTSGLKFFWGRADLRKKLEEKISFWGLTPANIFRANQAIISYLDTPIGLGLRHKSFFSSAVGLAYAGLTKNQLLEILESLDYDGSRCPEDVGSQLKKYGLIGKKNTNTPTDAALDHLRQLQNFDRTAIVNRWLSEATPTVVDLLKSSKVLVMSAATGLGKTHFCIGELPKIWKGKIFFGVPTKSLRDSIKKNFDDGTVQFLEQDQYLDSTAKSIVTTYEKLVHTRSAWTEADLVVLDECHLMEKHFRSWASEILLQEIKNPRSPKFLLMSATGQGMSRVLKELMPSEVVTLKVESSVSKKLDLDVKICSSPFDRLVDDIKEKLQGPSKILVYRNSLSDLEELAKIIGPDFLIVSSESKACDPAVQAMFEGVEPQNRVLGVTSIAEVGVSIPWINDIFVCSGKGPQIQVSNIVQIADRARRPVPVTWYVSKNRPSDSRLGHYTTDFISTYISIIDQWASCEEKRMRFLLGPQKSKDFGEIKSYLSLLDEKTLAKHKASDVQFPLCGTLCSDKNGGLSPSIQGILENIDDCESIMETSLKYRILKLEVLHGVNVKISTCADKAVSSVAKEDSVWTRLQVASEKMSATEIQQQLESIVDSIGLRPSKKNAVLTEVWRRFMVVSQKKLSLKDYLFIEDPEWEEVLYSLSLRETPHLHQMEKKWIDEILNLASDKIFFADAKEALKKALVSADHEHLKNKLLELPSQTLSKILSKLLHVKSGKTKDARGIQARYLKLVSRTPKWMSLKDEPKCEPIPPIPVSPQISWHWMSEDELKNFYGEDDDPDAPLPF